MRPFFTHNKPLPHQIEEQNRQRPSQQSQQINQVEKGERIEMYKKINLQNIGMLGEKSKKRPLSIFQEEQDQIGMLPLTLKADFVKEDQSEKQSVQSQDTKAQSVQKYVEKEVIVKYKNGYDENDQSQFLMKQQEIAKERIEGQKHNPFTIFQEDLQEEEKTQSLIHQYTKEQKINQDLQVAFSKLDQALAQSKQQNLIHNRTPLNKDIQYSDVDLIKVFDYHAHLLQQLAILKHGEGLPRSVLNDFIRLDKQVSIGFLEDLNCCYMSEGTHLIIWCTHNCNESLFKMDFPFQVLNVEIVTLREGMLDQKYLLIATSEQIFKYSISLTKGSTYKIKIDNQVEPLSTDRTNIYKIVQTSGGRIFIGGSKGHVSEINLVKASFISSFFSKNTPQKMKKVDQSQSIFDKLLPSFFKSEKKLLVLDIEENQHLNNLFVLIDDYTIDVEQVEGGRKESYIEVYDLGRSGQEFIKVMDIKMQDIFDEIQNATSFKLNDKYRNLNTILSISSDFNFTNALRIVFQNGMRVILSFDLQTQEYSIFQKSSWYPLSKESIDESTFKSQFIGKESKWHLSKIQFSPIGSSILKYQNIWDSYQGFNDAYIWTPLMTVPIQVIQNDLHSHQLPFQILLYKEYQDQYVYIVKSEDAQKKDSLYLLYESSNKANEDRPNIINVVQISQKRVYDISFTLENKRQVINVLTEQGIVKYIVPLQQDVIASYLNLISLSSKPEQLESSYLQLIQFDFSNFLEYSSLSSVLESLLHILTYSTNHDFFLLSNLCEMHYKNSDQITRQHQGNERVILQQLSQTTKNYLGQEQSSYQRITTAIQEAAIQYYLRLTESNPVIQESLILNEERKTQQRQKASLETNILKPYLADNIKEYQRVESLYSFIVKVFGKLFQSNLFEPHHNGKQLNINIEPESLEETIKTILSLKNFVIQNQVLLKSCQRQEIPHYEDDILIQDLIDQQILLLKRIEGGLNVLSRMYTFMSNSQSQYVLSAAQNIHLMILCKTNLYEYLYSGIDIPGVCDILESYIYLLESPNLLDSHIIKEISLSSEYFIPTSILKLFVARKNLGKASQMADCQERINLITQSISLIFKNPLRAHLGIVGLEFLKNDLVNQTIQFSLYKTKNIDALKQNFSEKINQSNAEEMEGKFIEWEMEKTSCFTLIIEIFQTITDRLAMIQQEQMKQQDGQLTKDIKQEREPSEFEGINVFRKKLSNIKEISHLLKLKDNALNQAIQNSNQKFHYALYDYLIREGQSEDLVKLNTPFVKDYIHKIMGMEEQDLKNGEGLSSKRQMEILLSRMEATYMHLKSIKQFEECFNFIIEHIIDADIQMEISERIQWIIKAEGCYEKIPEARRSIDKHLKELSKKFYTNKEYFFVILKIRNKIRKIGKLLRQADENEQVLENEDLDSKFSYSLPDVNEAYNNAINLKMWAMVLKILKIFEYENLQTKDQEIQLQKKINVTWDSILSDLYSIRMTRKQYHKIQRVLLTLYSQYKSIKDKKIQFVPLTYIINCIEEVKLQYFDVYSHFSSNLLIQEQKDNQYWSKQIDLQGEYHPFWHIELIIQNSLLSFEQLLQILMQYIYQSDSKIEVNTSFIIGQKDIKIERCFSSIYLIIRWREIGKDIQSGKSMIRVIKKINSEVEKAFADPLLFSKENYEQIKKMRASLEDAINFFSNL